MSSLFGSATLEVAIGLALVYLLLAVMCTAVNEWIARMLRLRSNNLKTAIQQLLDNQPGQRNQDPDTKDSGLGFLRQFYQHPLISGMTQGGKHPDYLGARTFSTVIIDLVTRGQSQVSEVSHLLGGIQDNLPDGDLKTALISLLKNADTDLSKAQKNIEQWYDDSMDRASGWYKRKIQVITVILALILAVALNADTIQIAHKLWVNPELRATALKLAEQRVEQQKEKQAAPQYEYKNADKPLEPSLKKPSPPTAEEKTFMADLIGWQKDSPPFQPWNLLGWLLTGIAVSLGAPFWFDILSRFVNIRSSGKTPAEAKKQTQANQPA